MSIVTGSGDDGHSALFGGKRVPKHHPRLEAYGTVDEAQSAIGMIRAGSKSGLVDSLLSRLQKELFIVGSDLATPTPSASAVPRVTAEMIRILEDDCAKLESELPPLKSFILPFGTPAAATCFWARTVVRRAERCVAELKDKGENIGNTLVYLNRLGDLLFLVSRKLNQDAGVDEESWGGLQE